MNNRRYLGVALVLIAVVGTVFPQDIGDHFTAGYSNSRTYLNSDQGSFVPPVSLVNTVELAGVTNASSLLVFENGGVRHFLVGQDTSTSVEYHLFRADNGLPEWNPPITFNGSEGLLNFQPAYSNDLVILGGGTTTTVRAVMVSTGAEVWEDSAVGVVNGRFPILTNNLALYHGRSGLRAVAPMDGPSTTFFQVDVTTAQAPVSMHGSQAYLLETPGTLHAIDAGSGAVLWSLSGLESDNPNIIATEKYVFINKTSDSTFGAFTAADGLLAWAQTASTLSETPGMALAYDRLFVFKSDDGLGDAEVSVHNPDTGDAMWSASEPGSGLDYGVVANNLVYYYHQATQRIRARHAFTGQLVWSHHVEGVRGLSFSGGHLFVLTADQVDEYRPSSEIYFAHIADGGGQQTLMTLNTTSSEEVTATVFFYGSDGSPLPLDVEGVGVVPNLAVTIPAGGTARVRTLGGESPVGGWARVVADGPVTGSSIFQFSDELGEILNEAGVANSDPSGSARLYVEIELPPTRPLAIGTGFAIANTSDETATINVALLAADGSELETVQIQLEADQHAAQFVGQLFPEQAVDGFQGTLTVSSDVPVIVTALRTQAGLQLSSYVVSP